MELNEGRISQSAQDMFDLVDWYEQICLDDSFNDIETLIKNHGRLSALAVIQARKFRVLAKECRTHHANRRVQTAIRQIELQESNDGFTGKTYTAAKAEAVALKENQDVYIKEYTAQGEMEGSEIILKQVNQVLFAMFHHIQELKGNRRSEERTESDHG